MDSMSKSQWQTEARPPGTLTRVHSHSPCQWNCSLSAWAPSQPAGSGPQGRSWSQVCSGGLPWQEAAQGDLLPALLAAVPCCCPRPESLLWLLAAGQGQHCPVPHYPRLFLCAPWLFHPQPCPLGPQHWELGQPHWLCCSALQGSAPLLPGYQLPSPGGPNPCRLQVCLHWHQQVHQHLGLLPHCRGVGFLEEQHMCQATLWFEMALCFEEGESPVPRRWTCVSLLYSSSFSIKK